MNEGILWHQDHPLVAEDILTKLKTVDGSTTGLDADLLDGQHASYFLPAGTYTAADVLAKLLTVDGPGSGLDADKLDGTELAKILALGTTIPGSANLNSYTATGLYHQPNTANAASGTNYPVALAGMLEVIGDSSIVYQKYTAYDSAHSVYVRTCYNSTWYSWTRVLDNTDLTTINNNLALKLNANVYTAADILAKLLTVDGSGSGLDADTLDGKQGSYYQEKGKCGTVNVTGSGTRGVDANISFGKTFSSVPVVTCNVGSPELIANPKKDTITTTGFTVTVLNLDNVGWTATVPIWWDAKIP